MSSVVAVPVWLLVLLFALAAWALLDRLLMPGVRWWLRRRVNRVIDEVNTRLNISIRPFQLTKRAVLIDRLVYDPKVVEAMDAYAAEQGMPREVAQAEVRRYAHEIVPAFNAYVYFRAGYWIAERLARLLYRVRVGFADNERLARIERARALMVKEGLGAIVLTGGTSLVYYTNLSWGQSERMFAVILPAKGNPAIVCPAFEADRAGEQIKRSPLASGAELLSRFSRDLIEVES